MIYFILIFILLSIYLYCHINIIYYGLIKKDNKYNK